MSSFFRIHVSIDLNMENKSFPACPVSAQRAPVSHRCRKLSQHLFFRREKTVRWLEALYALLAKVDIVVLSTGILHGQTLKIGSTPPTHGGKVVHS